MKRDLQKLIENAAMQPAYKKAIGIRKNYAVMMIFVTGLSEYAEEPCLLFEKRAANLDTQPDEICFPGGMREEGESLLKCAVRETEEELAIAQDRLNIYGEIMTLYSYANFSLHVFAAELDGRYLKDIEASADEVAEWFIIPLHEFEETKPFVKKIEIVPDTEDFPCSMVGIDKDYPWRKGSYDVPVYKIGGRTVWGITARLIMDFVNKFRKG